MRYASQLFRLHLFSLLLVVPVAAQFPLFEEAIVHPDAYGYAGKGGTQPSQGNVNVVALFARFAGESAPAFPSSQLTEGLFADRPGSFSHFYDTMSFGRLRVHGTVLPGSYSSRLGKAVYLSRTPGELGQYGRFVTEVVRQADRDIDFRRYDNDGPDGEPDSGDDDGVVDYLFIILNSVPADFIIGGVAADGVANLGLEQDIVTGDIGASGTAIRIGVDRDHGTLLRAGTLAQTVGNMSHEFGHAFGLPDLYDVENPTPEETSAGIGAWGLMGRGSAGWHGNDGPLPMGAYSRERLGWLGPDGDRLIEVRGDTTGLELRDLDQGGALVRVPLHTSVSAAGMVYEEYLLLELRTRAGSHYDRDLPAEGVLMWHVRPQLSNNNNEMAKQVDIVCADGLYTDGGFPGGEQPDPFTGRDNLDFWSKDGTYNSQHDGNLGDGTDLFDGRRYTRFDAASNPSAATAGRGRVGNSGLHIQFHADAGRMYVDVRQPRWSGRIDGETIWIGDVAVDGDVVVGPDGHLKVYRSTRARFAAGTGLTVEGSLEVPRQAPRKRTRGKWSSLDAPVLMEVGEAGATWRGLLLADGAITAVPHDLLQLRDTMTVVEYDASVDVATAVTDMQDSVVSFGLGQNYPNPFQGSTTIPYRLAEAADARLEIFNALGQRIATPLDEYTFAGAHELVWMAQTDDGRRLAGGMLLYRLTAGGAVDQGKMLFLGGMANLQDAALDWSKLGASLGASGTVLGFGSGRAPSASAAGFEAGRALGSLQILAAEDRAPATAQAEAYRLAGALRSMQTSGAAPRRAEALATALASGRVDAAILAARLMRLERIVNEAIRHQGPQTELLFQSGAWLQHLRAAVLAARALGRPMSAFADPGSNAGTGRYFADELSGSEADAEQTPWARQVSAALREVARYAESDPAAVPQLQEMLDRIDAVGASMFD